MTAYCCFVSLINLKMSTVDVNANLPSAAKSTEEKQIILGGRNDHPGKNRSKKSCNDQQVIGKQVSYEDFINRNTDKKVKKKKRQRNKKKNEQQIAKEFCSDDKVAEEKEKEANDSREGITKDDNASKALFIWRR